MIFDPLHILLSIIRSV